MRRRRSGNMERQRAPCAFQPLRNLSGNPNFAAFRSGELALSGTRIAWAMVSSAGECILFRLFSPSSPRPAFFSIRAVLRRQGVDIGSPRIFRKARTLARRAGGLDARFPLSPPLKNSFCCGKFWLLRVPRQAQTAPSRPSLPRARLQSRDL